MSPFLRVGTECSLHVDRCPHFRVLEWRVSMYIEVSPFLRVGTECRQRCLHFRGHNKLFTKIFCIVRFNVYIILLGLILPRYPA